MPYRAMSVVVVVIVVIICAAMIIDHIRNKGQDEKESAEKGKHQTDFISARIKRRSGTFFAPTVRIQILCHI